MFALRASKQMTINNQPPMFRFVIKPVVVVVVVFLVKFLNFLFGPRNLNLIRLLRQQG